MTLFWIVVGLLIVAALCFVVPPLLKRDDAAAGPTRVEVNRALYRQRLAELQRDVDNDLLTQTQYDRGRLDLERELLAEAADDTAPATRPSRGGAGWSAWLVGIAVPVFAILFYLQFSTGFDALNETGMRVSATGEPERQPTIEEIAGAIQARLEQNPEDRTAWVMLARVRTLMGRYAAASEAYAQADALSELNEPDLLAAYAQTLAFANGQQFAGRPAALLDQALEIKPDNPQALWLAGWADFQQQNFARAAERWERLRETAPADLLERFQDLPARIAQAKRLAGQTTTAADTSDRDTGETAESAPPASITVAVTLAPRLAGRAVAEDTVFVYALAVDGPRMPLALARGTVADLPLEVTLDDSMAMAPAFKLSGADEVKVIARISKSGEAIPQSGDLLGESGQVRTQNDARVSITIDEIVP